MNVEEFAKAMDLTTRAVRAGIGAGRLAATKGKNGSWVLADLKISKKEWRAKTEPGKRTSGRRKTRKKPVETSPPSEFDFDAARAKKESYNAKMAELEYKKKTGELISIAEIEADAFKVYRTHRDKLLSMPAKWAYKMASEQDVHACEIYLAQELNDALEELADAFKGK